MRILIIVFVLAFFIAENKNYINLNYILNEKGFTFLRSDNWVKYNGSKFNIFEIFDNIYLTNINSREIKNISNYQEKILIDGKNKSIITLELSSSFKENLHLLDLNIENSNLIDLTFSCSNNKKSLKQIYTVNDGVFAYNKVRFKERLIINEFKFNSNNKPFLISFDAKVEGGKMSNEKFFALFGQSGQEIKKEFKISNQFKNYTFFHNGILDEEKFRNKYFGFEFRNDNPVKIVIKNIQIYNLNKISNSHSFSFAKLNNSNKEIYMKNFNKLYLKLIFNKDGQLYLNKIHLKRVNNNYESKEIYDCDSKR